MEANIGFPLKLYWGQTIDEAKDILQEKCNILLSDKNIIRPGDNILYGDLKSNQNSLLVCAFDNNGLFFIEYDITYNENKSFMSNLSNELEEMYLSLFEYELIDINDSNSLKDFYIPGDTVDRRIKIDYLFDPISNEGKGEVKTVFLNPNDRDDNIKKIVKKRKRENNYKIENFDEALKFLEMLRN